MEYIATAVIHYESGQFEEFYTEIVKENFIGPDSKNGNSLKVFEDFKKRILNTKGYSLKNAEITFELDKVTTIFKAGQRVKISNGAVVSTQATSF